MGFNLDEAAYVPRTLERLGLERPDLILTLGTLSGLRTSAL